MTPDNKNSSGFMDVIKRRDFWVFCIPSLLGIALFLIPLKTQDGVSIPIAVLAKALAHACSGFIDWLIVGIIAVSALASCIATITRPAFITHNAWLRSLLLPGIGWLIIRLIGAFFVSFCFFSIGPSEVYHSETGQLVFTELLPTLFSVFIFAGLFLPLLLNFGLLEFFGTLASKVMRPLFDLPGRSAIDCCTSWLGDGSVGILLTSKQYEQGFYTQREAAVIATNFSAVSITFSLVVLAQVNLQQHFINFYLTVCLCGIVCAIILPRIPPLSLKSDRYIDGSKTSADNSVNKETPLLTQSFTYALARAATIKSFREQLKYSLHNVIDMLFGLLPVIMAIGTIALMIAEFTPLFDIIGKPFIPLLELFGIPEATEASKTVMVGFADMFVPSILSVPIESPMTRFFIAVLSVTQLIYLSEVGALILGSKIPIRFYELFLLFILRTLICIPIIAGMAHIYFK